MYLDRHDAVDGTAEDIAAAHQADLALEEKYGVHYHTYWFDPEQHTVFCLATGPDKDSVDRVHKESHGLAAQNIIEIDPNVPLNQMFGPMPTYPAGTAYTAPAIRAIVFTDLCGSVEQTQRLGDDGHIEILHQHNDIVRSNLKEHDGREVKHTGDGIMAAFTSVAGAVSSCIGMQRAFLARNAEAAVALDVSIGISAGEPVTGESDDLFGAAAQLAVRLCAAANAGDIMTSVAVRELCIGKPFLFCDAGKLTLKGMPEPTQGYTVAWREDAQSC
ncbi:MAG TPA: nickel-binding protein [Acidimicrobiia bacterium]|nr:nickel-binding protein [Acidimicrobiia bacterium]